MVKRILHGLLGYKITSNPLFWKYTVPKMLLFDRFNRKYIPTHHIASISDMEHCEYYLVGSDQVWNVNWFSDDDIRKELFFLTFCRAEEKICISPSFGFETVPKKWESFIQECLQTITHLSVREESGARIIKELTGREAPVLIDPTMLLERDEWRKIARKPRRKSLSDPYILTYFLGDCSPARKQEIHLYAQQLGAKVYPLQDISEPDLYVTDPGEFISLIDHAMLILTDSFHASVFSFLFEKPFLVYDREGAEPGMISRVTTLLNKFDLQRKYRGNNLENDLLECDYENGLRILEVERNRFINYLEHALHNGVMSNEN